MSILLSAKLLSIIGNIERFGVPSSLWHYAGLHVVNGKAPKRRRGQEATWNPKLKSLAWLIAKGQVMSRGPFRKYYDEYKRRDTLKHPDYRKFYLNTRAYRYCAKMFLLEFWIASYQALGLEPPADAWILTQPEHHRDPLVFPYCSQNEVVTQRSSASHRKCETHQKNAKPLNSTFTLNKV